VRYMDEGGRCGKAGWCGGCVGDELTKGGRVEMLGGGWKKGMLGMMISGSTDVG
jgi:hypothetical protein